MVSNKSSSIEPPYRLRRNIAQRAEYVVESIVAMGLRLNPTSRLFRMHHVLADRSEIAGPEIPVGHPWFELAVEATRDMTLLAFVFDHAAELTETAGFHEAMRRAIKDSELPQDDGEQTQGRDAQFELFVCALCQASNMKPVKFAEPDICCATEEQEFGIAAKRIKNPKQLIPRLKKAATQVARSKLPGVIAVETTVALNRSNVRFGANIADTEFPKLHAAAVNRFALEFMNEIQEAVRGSGVRGIVLHDHQVKYSSTEGWGLESMNYWISTAREHQKRNREFRVFKNAYLRGLPECRQIG